MPMPNYSIQRTRATKRLGVFGFLGWRGALIVGVRPTQQLLALIHEMNLHKLIAAFLLAAPIFAHAEQAAVVAFSQPLLLGMQLAAKHGERRGEITATQLRCVQTLSPSAFFQVVATAMTAALTREELETANGFFATPVGRKYLKHGMLQLYSAVGETAPEALPNFSDAEYRELEAFAGTSAGKAIIAQRVMQSASAKCSYDARIRELMEQCSAK